MFTVTKELFSSRREQDVRKRNSTGIREFFTENMKILIKILTVSICPKIT